MNKNNSHQHEIEHFSTLAQHWWDPHGPMRTLHAINPCRVDYINKTQPQLQGLSCLDIGCGGGILSEALAKQGACVTGIDLSEPAIATAKQHAKTQNLNIDYQVIPCETLANTKPHSFDTVVCMEMLEHVPDPQAIVQAAAKLCKSNGHLFFSTINQGLKAYLEVIFAGEYLLKIIPKNTHHYAQFIRPATLASWCRNEKLHIRDISGLSFYPLTHNAKITTKPQSNYLLTCQPNNE